MDDIYVVFYLEITSLNICICNGHEDGLVHGDSSEHIA